ncbi:MAG: hypothetical protein HGB06_11300 [Chlorobaculum sp.]|nr:hypothetical protein [Chlorobaculum sp.]
MNVIGSWVSSTRSLPELRISARSHEGVVAMRHQSHPETWHKDALPMTCVC